MATFNHMKPQQYSNYVNLPVLINSTIYSILCCIEQKPDFMCFHNLMLI